MFIGHFALAFASKGAAPRVNLATLFAASQLPDLVWPLLVATGAEQVRIAPGDTAFTPLEFVSYPWSHSLLFVAGWAIAFAAFHRLWTGRGGAVVLGSLVLSHWALDVITHRPDLPAYPGGPMLGFGLWNSVPGTLVVEGALFAWGAWLYARRTRARSRSGRWALRSLLGVLVLAYVANVLAAPPSVDAVWSGALVGGMLLLAWAAWADRTRVPNPAP
jgi:hypothetical protein